MTRIEFRSESSDGPSVAILGFHKIGPPPPDGWESWFYVSVPIFDRFLTELRDEGWDVIGADRLLRGLESPDTLPARSAVLTFDDGYRSMRDVTLPVLQRHGAPGILFVPTDYIGGVNAFDQGVEPEEVICDWADLRALAESGVSIQSHAVSHRPFSKLTPEERDRELRDSKKVLEAGLGAPVDLIAFPYGDAGPDEEIGRLAANGYRAAFLYRGSPVRLPASSPYRLERIAMGPNTDLGAALRGAA